MFFFNPFMIFNFSIVIVLFFSSLQWSFLYVNINNNTLIFIGLLFLSNILISFFCYKDREVYFPDRKQNKRLRHLLYLLYIINFVYSKEIPIVNVIFNVGSYYKDINNIPTIFPLAMALNVFLIIDLFARLKVDINKKDNVLVLIFLFTLIMIHMGRGIFVMCFLHCIFYYLLSRKNVFSLKTLKVISYIIGLLFVFSLWGNIRSASNEVINSGNSKLTRSFSELVEPTKAFHEAGLPDSVLWVYAYAVSPLYNLDNTFNIEYNSGTCSPDFILRSVLPESFQKNFLSPVDELYGGLISPIFNVSTTFFTPYYYCGWIGVLIYIITFFMIFLTQYILVRKSEYKNIFLAQYCTVFLLSTFSNMFILDVLFIPLLITVLLSLYSRLKCNF
jgi:hypothetical protein